MYYVYLQEQDFSAIHGIHGSCWWFTIPEYFKGDIPLKGS